MKNELQDRILDFKLMQLPGQPQMMHVGTSNLVNDLEIAWLQSQKKLDKIQSYLEWRDQQLMANDGPARATHEECEADLRYVYKIVADIKDE